MPAPIPAPIQQVARKLLGPRYFLLIDRCAVLSEALTWSASLKGQQSARRIKAVKNKHWGERCFILGNGPSLKKMDLQPLAQEVTFGLNRIYLLFGQMGFPTTYYVAVNRLVIEQCAEEIERIPVPKFLNWHSHDLVRFTADMMFLKTGVREPRFTRDITRSLWEGATVTYVAVQIAYYMGFHQVILVGVDHSFATKGKPHSEIVSTGDDPNHFAPNYFGKGFRWQLPDLETSERAYRLAKRYFEQDGREILDATVGGKLEVFPKIDYQMLFQDLSLCAVQP